MTLTLLPREALADRSWTERAACRPGTGVPADMFATETRPARAAAVHVCRVHCPVMGECDLEAKGFIGTADQYRSMVAGGVAYNQYGKVDARRMPPVRCPLCTVLPKPWPEPGEQARGKTTTEPAPCGTTAGYSRHRRHREPICEPCRAAHNARVAECKQARILEEVEAAAVEPAQEVEAAAEPAPEEVVAPCGTEGGYLRHRRRGEDRCTPCRLAHNAATAERKRIQRINKGGRPRRRYDDATVSAVRTLVAAGHGDQLVGERLGLTAVQVEYLRTRHGMRRAGEVA